jgi:hypothetical protein
MAIYSTNIYSSQLLATSYQTTRHQNQEHIIIIFIIIIINSLDQSLFWKGNSSLASWEIWHIWGKQKVYYHVQKSLLLVPVHRQITPVRAIHPISLEPFYYQSPIDI